VLCRWTRQDELTWSPFGAAMRVRLSADLDADGQIISWCGDIYSPPHVTRPGSGEASGVNLLAAWQLEQPVEKTVPKLTPNISQGDRNAVPLYRLKGRNIRHHFLPNWPLRASAMRSLGAHCNVFAIESFMDELAVLTGRDPVEWRLSLLEDHRARAVIEAVVKDSGWDPCEEGGNGSGHGLAFAQYKNSSAYCAVVARVEISDTVRLLSVHAAVDCGRVVHRDGVLNQIEGGIIQASSWTLKEEIAWDADGLLSKDWSTYPILGFRECPAISVNILHRPEMPPLGTGECATGPTAGAIANAVHHALGIRVRHMPLTVDRIVSAIHAASN
jgi:nicotinate dehydrogenase subunit B